MSALEWHGNRWCYVRLDSVLNQPWINWATCAQYMTDLRPTDHLPSVVELRPTRPRTLLDKTDTTPTYNRQTTDNLSGRDLSNMFERSLPDKFVCLNINRHQTNKTKSIPIINQAFPEFDDFCRFEVGFVSVWPVWLGYYRKQHIQWYSMNLSMERHSPICIPGVLLISAVLVISLSTVYVPGVPSSVSAAFSLCTTGIPGMHWSVSAAFCRR